MNRTKKLGLIIAAMAAMMAFVGASSASAAEFHTNKVGATLHGTQSGSHEFVVQGSKVTCTTASFAGTTSALTAKTQTMTPTYTGCTAFGFVGATVNMNGCDYLFDGTGTTVDLVCPAGKFVTIHVNTGIFGTCHVDVTPKTGINGISYANSADKKTMTVTNHSTNINFNVTTSTGVCPLTVGSGTNGTYKGTTTVTAGGSTIWRE